MTEDQLSLDQAVMGAAEAPPLIRIEYRDQIARYGSAGIARVESWLHDPKMAAFAVRAIARAADFGAADDARRVLLDALPVLAGPVRSDALSAIDQLGGKPSVPRRATSRSVTTDLSLDRLVEGQVYKRADIHASGLGGNRQKGISYPAGGSYVLLFSDPDTAAQWGYRDTWVGSDTYRYYGEWDGTGDMLMRGGNLAIVERSPEIYLFVKAPGGHRFAGVFECRRNEQVRAAREGREFQAIVFTLERHQSRSRRPGSKLVP